MDAILTGDASEEDYARAASAAVLIPMLTFGNRACSTSHSHNQTLSNRHITKTGE